MLLDNLEGRGARFSARMLCASFHLASSVRGKIKYVVALESVKAPPRMARTGNFPRQQALYSRVSTCMTTRTVLAPCGTTQYFEQISYQLRVFTLSYSLVSLLQDSEQRSDPNSQV